MIVVGTSDVRRERHFRGLRFCLQTLRRHNPGVRLVVMNRRPEQTHVVELVTRLGGECLDVTRWHPPDHGPVLTRNLYYLHWLEENAIQEPVLCLDLFDVYVQGALDGTLATEGLTVAEAARIVKDCPLNRSWLQTQFHPEAVATCWERPVLCAGVFGGTAHDLRRFLSWYAMVLNDLVHHRAPLTGLDQAALMVHAYTGIGPWTPYPAVNPSWMHLGDVPEADFVWERTQARHTSGVVPRLLHQVNRHRDLRRHIYRTEVKRG